ncbi:hypothetical protein G6F31_020487 [Rhizopus arrhizus]|nr:hypothetical protein G6F31_020487 [Rhizopus arrhizus]
MLIRLNSALFGGSGLQVDILRQLRRTGRHHHPGADRAGDDGRRRILLPRPPHAFGRSAGTGRPETRTPVRQRRPGHPQRQCLRRRRRLAGGAGRGPAAGPG